MSPVAAAAPSSSSNSLPRPPTPYTRPWSDRLLTCGGSIMSPVAAAAPSSSSNSHYSQDLQPHIRPWSDLPIDLLSKIFSGLETTLDVVHFSLVCPSWKAASYINEFHHSKQFPWLLLREEDLPTVTMYSWYSTDPRTGCRRFIIPTGYEQLTCPLPEACGRRCVGSGYGWLLMLAKDDQITMVRPLTGVCLPLPPQSTLKFPSQWHHKEKYRSYISKIALGKDNSGGTVAIAIAGDRRKLAIARPTDHKWTAIKCKLSRITDVVFHQGRIYAVDYTGTLVACNLAGGAKRIAAPPKEKLDRRLNWYIVVSSSGKLLQVAREYGNHREDGTRGFKVFELLHEEARWVLTKDLGDQALFLGFNTSTSLKASCIPGCEANCIYFSDDCIDDYRPLKYGGGYDTGKCNLSDKSVKRYRVGKCPFSPPLWYIPTLP